MKVKFFFVYIAAAVAFAAVSLWVFFSRGRSSRAIRTKYRMGGVMLTAWAMLSACSCNGPVQVLCYEPVVTCYDTVAPTDLVTVTALDDSSKVKPTDTVKVSIRNHSYTKYICRITATDLQDALIQSVSFEVSPDAATADFEFTLVATDYRGHAGVTVAGITVAEDGSESESVVGTTYLIII